MERSDPDTYFHITSISRMPAYQGTDLFQSADKSYQTSAFRRNHLLSHKMRCFQEKSYAQGGIQYNFAKPFRVQCLNIHRVYINNAGTLFMRVNGCLRLCSIADTGFTCQRLKRPTQSLRIAADVWRRINAFQVFQGNVGHAHRVRCFVQHASILFKQIWDCLVSKMRA